MPPAAGHVIWGEVELSAGSDSTQDSNLTGNDPADSKGVRGLGSGQAMPSEIAQYLSDVHFQQSSCSSIDNSPASHPASQVSTVSGHFAPFPAAVGGPHNGRPSSAARPSRSGAGGAFEGPPPPDAAGSGGPDEGDLHGLLQELAGDRSSGRLEGGSLDKRVAEALVSGLWSKGTAKHKEGKCRPCHYIHTPGGCAGGKDCRFCHMPHTGQNKSRLGASKRNMCKQIADTIEGKLQGDKDGMLHAATLLGSRSQYLRSILEERANASASKGADPPRETPFRQERRQKVLLSL